MSQLKTVLMCGLAVSGDQEFESSLAQSLQLRVAVGKMEVPMDRILT